MIRPTAPKVESLASTDDTFQETINGAHLQVAIWRNPPQVNPTDYGWVIDVVSSWMSQSLLAIPLGIELVPGWILNVVRCGSISSPNNILVKLTKSSS